MLQEARARSQERTYAMIAMNRVLQVAAVQGLACIQLTRTQRHTSTMCLNTLKPQESSVVLESEIHLATLGKEPHTLMRGGHDMLPSCVQQHLEVITGPNTISFQYLEMLISPRLPECERAQRTLHCQSETASVH